MFKKTEPAPATLLVCASAAEVVLQDSTDRKSSLHLPRAQFSGAIPTPAALPIST